MIAVPFAYCAAIDSAALPCFSSASAASFAAFFCSPDSSLILALAASVSTL